MNSKIRDTFGIVDQRTKKIYPDILDYSLLLARFSQSNLFQRTFLVRTSEGITTEYILHMDAKLKRALKLLEPINSIEVIISLQKRTESINIALARIYQRKEQEKKEES